jgi:hypothetical protein
MRNIRKSIKVREVECLIYDRTAKAERAEIVKVAEVEEMPKLPENCILIEQKVLSEKEVVYSMTPGTFVAHATIIEE